MFGQSTCSGVLSWCSAISPTTESFSSGPCTDLDLLKDILGVPGSSSDPLSDKAGLLFDILILVVGTPRGVWAETWMPFTWQNFTSSSCLQKGCNST